jgi:signal transduction histidine kinase/ligand-binding sensor domain-containing protein
MSPRTGSFLLSLIVLLHASSAVALDPNKSITQYKHRSWRVEDGTLPNLPSWIAQTTDGYLRIGLSSTGAWRFDGVRFVPWSPSVISSNNIHYALPAKAGGFWISDSHGVVHIEGKRVLAHFDSLGPVYGQMVEDVDGSLWVAKYPYAGTDKPLCHVTDQAAQCFGEKDGVHFTVVSAIALDGKGGVWIGTDTALVHWRSGHSEIYECAALRTNTGQNAIQGIVPDSDGSLWVGVASPGVGLQKFVDGAFRPVVIGPFDGRKIVVDELFMDHDQNLWVGTNADGLYQIHGQTVDHFGKTDGLSGNQVYGIYEDRERIIWVATSGGLDSFADQSITTFSLPAENSVSVAATRDGTIWVGNYGSLDSIRNGIVSSIRPSDGLPGEQVTSLLEDHAGQLWVGVDDGLFLYENHHFRRLPEPNHHPLGMVAGITEDTDGNIWAECASKPRKLVRIRNFEVQEEFSSSQVPAGHALAADPKSGIWVMTLTEDLVRIQNSNVRTFPLKLNGEMPRQIEAETDGSVLAASESEGLLAIRQGKVQRLTKGNGLPCDGVFAFVRDDQKSLWLETPCGYVSVADSEMQRWLVHPDAVVQYQTLDRFDGARPFRSDFNGAAKSSDGRLWFSQGNVQTIDPHHLLFNKLPPLVHIEQIIADHKAHELDGDASAKVTLPARIRELEIDYTALSLLVPQKVLFRYKLDGLDHEWHDVGNRRQAFYTNLGPGNYSFHVIACNNDGVWNEEGAGLDFRIPPAWYQTYWFRAFCVGVFGLLLWSLYQLRVQQLQRQFNIGLEARVSERTRIARELHDTLLQSFHGLLLRFQAASNLLPNRPDDAKKRLDAAIDQGSQAIAEGRDAVQGLRPATMETNDLAVALRILGEELTGVTNLELPAIDVSVEGETRRLYPLVRDEVYRISAEALRNAFRHAKAKRIETEIRYSSHEFRIRIRDDGKGMDIEAAAGGAGHFGLPGMRERAKVLGANLEIWSDHDSGTEVQLTMPASTAYETSETYRRFRIFERAKSS